MIRCAQGSVLLPRAGDRVSEALKLADQEVQAERATLRSHGVDDIAIGPRCRRRASHRSPYDVVELAVAVGQRLGLSGDELDHLECAAAAARRRHDGACPTGPTPPAA